MTDLGERIRARRKELGLSQGKLAQMAELTASAISQIESGAIRTLKNDTLSRLAVALQTTALELMAGGAGSAIGRGGMLTKILAAKRAAGSGASTVIAWGREPDALLRLAAGEAIGTALVAGTPKLAARKQWMVDHLQLRGAVVVDDGAVVKLRDEGKSLLPIGVTEVEGGFRRGDVIAVRSTVGVEIARGLANYASTEARLIARKPSSQIAGLLGFANEPELIHRDNLVLM